MLKSYFFLGKYEKALTLMEQHESLRFDLKPAYCYTFVC